MKRLILMLMLGAALACAQSTIYLGAGPSIHSDLPYGAANVTLGLCNSDASTCALLNYAGRGSVQNPTNLVYSSSAGVRQVVGTAGVNASRVDLFLLGNAGATIASSATGFTGAVGGGLTFHTARFPLWSFSIAAQGEYSPVNPGWRPNIFVQVGYLFHGK